MSTFHNQFTISSENPNRYHWTTVKPLFRSAVVSFVPPSREDTEACSDVEVAALCENGNEFGQYHEAAWNFIVDNTNSVESNLKRKLFVHHLKGYRGLIDQSLPHFAEYQIEDWNEIKNAIKWETHDALDHLYQLLSIGLLDTGLDESGFCYFDFASGWDEEHGISILMHKSDVLAAGGISEFCNRGPELVGHVRAIQAYDLSDGDRRLDET